MTTVREAVHALLAEHGIDTIFGNPGSTEMRFFRDLPDTLRYVMAPQEASVVAMADGWAQATGRPGMAMVHSAAGLGHGLGNVFSAERNQTPLLVVAGQQTRSLLAHEPYLFAKDAAEFPKPYVKLSLEPADPQDVPAAIAQALAVATTAPYGPVFVSVPEDDWDVEVAPHRLPAGTVRSGAGLGPEALATLLEALDGADDGRIALVLGTQVADGEGRADAVRVAEATGADVWVAPVCSRSVFPEDHPRFAGFLQPVADQVHDVLAGYDLAVFLGAPVVTQHVPSQGAALPEGTRVLQVTAHVEHAAQAMGGERLVAPVPQALAALADALADRAVTASGNGTPARTPAPAPAERSGEALSPEHVLAVLADLLPDDAVVVEEAPTMRNAIHAHLPIRAGQDYHVAASGGLGWALPAAVGMSLARPGRPVVCVIGDGSVLYSLQAWWTAAQHGAHVVTVVLDNGGYAAMKAFGRRLGIPGAPGLDLPGVDLPALAGGFGVRGGRVFDTEGLRSALRDALAGGAPAVVDVVVGPSAGELY